MFIAVFRIASAETVNVIFEVTTVDDISISCAFYSCADESQNKSLIIVSPGYAQHHRTRSMKALAEDMAVFSDVVVISYRGNGHSGGRYSFGADETRDLQAVYKWAFGKYDDINILGFSLGAYVAFRFCAEQSPEINNLLLVSCPSSVEDVTLSGAAFLNPVIILFRSIKYQIEPENDIWFRWNWPFKKKLNLIKLAANLDIPAHFLIAEKDTLVYPEQTRKIIIAVKGEKSLRTMKNGIHAEHMYLQNPSAFINWVKSRILR